MPQTAPLAKIGSKVRIDLDRVRDRISSSLTKKLKEDPRGTVLSYKMTDGQGIGLVLELSDGTTSWFFDTELARN